MTPRLADNLHSLRVDLVGSLLRPARLKHAFAKWGTGEMTEEELQRIQDETIREVIGKQEAHHLPLVIDGEFRRTNFMESFSVVAGVEEWQSGVKTYHNILAREDTEAWKTEKGQDPILLNRKRVTQRLRLVRNRLLEDYRFAQSLTRRPVKVSLIGPGQNYAVL